jgi:predicted ATP-dependent endonuclease of OLD family
MNIEIKNFGPIEYLKIDLEKDLHLIYGKNAIGKSYAIYCVYCLLKNIKNKDSNRRHGYFINQGENDSFLQFLTGNSKLSESNVKPKSKDVIKTRDITSEFKDWVKNIFRDFFLNDFQNSLLNTFSSLENLKNRFNQKDFEIIINLPNHNNCKKIIISVCEGNLEVDLDLNVKNLELVEKTTKTTKYSVYLDGKKFDGKPTERERGYVIESFLNYYVQGIFQQLSKGMREIYFLPASRSGLYQGLNSFAPIIAELTQSRFFISNKKIELPTLSEPVSDYYIDLSTIDKKHFNKEFSQLVSMLESKILKGKVEFDDESKNITYEPTGLDIKLNLSEASSMVAEMSPLVLYLKHIINHKFQSQSGRYFQYWGWNGKGNDIFFIEEPEAHLHPDIQVDLMKVFAEFVKYNLKIFITSHSNYMFNELNNLILDNKIDRNKIAVYHLIQNENGTVQNPDMTVNEDGIYDENFQETSEKLYEERMRILEKE